MKGKQKIFTYLDIASESVREVRDVQSNSLDEMSPHVRVPDDLRVVEFAQEHFCILLGAVLLQIECGRFRQKGSQHRMRTAFQLGLKYSSEF